MVLILFQTVSGLFPTRNSATFHSKVGHFLSVNYRVILKKRHNLDILLLVRVSQSVSAVNPSSKPIDFKLCFAQI